MTTNTESKKMADMGVRLSTLWVFVMLNILGADVFGFMMPQYLKVLQTGYAGGIKITPEFLLAAAVFMEIPIAMTVLSRTLKYRVNRLANLIAAPITILYVTVGGASYPHYIFFASLEVIAMLLIIWSAWTWPNPTNDH